MIRIENLSKSFTLHNQGSAVIPVMAGAHLTVNPGECVGLTGQSGAGKSTLMRMVWGTTVPSLISGSGCAPSRPSAPHWRGSPP